MPAADTGARRIGPYTVVTRLDGASTVTGTAVPEHRFIARSADGDRTVLIGTPLPATDPRRYMAEAEASRYLLGPWILPAAELAAPGDRPWYARPYLPVLPLPTALAVLGGPLPERTVRALGVALAETLAVLHGQQLAHAGLCPAAVLLAADGPRLTCFGAVRAAAPEGAPRHDVPGLDAGSLPPEQASGGLPRAMGDVYALGATLAYAATGHTVPAREELPPALRSLVARCLARDPADRPQVAHVIDELSESGASQGARAEALLVPGWLPPRVVAALAHQSAAVLSAEVEPPTPAPAALTAAPAAPVPAPAPAPTPAPAPHPGP
ncbi:serine/threonine protein kinase [Streptomyces sp. NPDC001532]|uniref:serine/threonine protein kinase n=1 Tax=Streptomyces sp. NPDC001532 TaxID=3154520 RepID=UPI00332EDC82